MKRSLLLLLFIGALLIALACGGNGDGAPSADDTPAGETPSGDAGGEGGNLTLEQYFQRIEALDDLAEARLGELSPVPSTIQGRELTEGEQLELLSDFLDAQAPIVAAHVAALGDIDAPAAVEDLHIEFVVAGASYLSFASEADDPGRIAAGERFTAACFALQEFADGNGIAVDLDCLYTTSTEIDIEVPLE